MKKFFFILIVLIFFSGCQIKNKKRIEATNTNQNDTLNVQMANPASSFCLKNGGKLEGKIDEEGGQYNLCIFNDNTRCEEWSYFYGNCLSGKNLMVAFPKKNQEVSFPFEVIGQARVFENSFNYRVKDEEGKILISGISSSSAQDMGQFGDFKIKIDNFSQLPKNENIILEVFEYSAKDGSETNLVNIPLKINIDETSKINLYFTNNNLDPKITCTKVFPVQRFVPKTTAIGKKAIELLLTGPTSEEYNNGYQTNINPGTELNSLQINNGLANADFNQTLQEQVGGSCRVSAIREQITKTLKQFSTVKDVIIAINGNSEEILQP